MTSTVDSYSGPRVNLLPNASNFTIHDGHFLAAGHDLYYTVNSPDTKSKILQWLKAPDPSPNFYAARDDIQKGTGLWFLADTQFINWKQNPGLLWMQGKAGSGKTFLCTSIIQELLNSSDHTSMLLVHYFDSRTESKQTYQGCLLSLLAQGTVHFQGVPPELEHMVKDRNNVFEEPSIQDIDKTLNVLLRQWTPTVPIYIVMDAFDECTGKEQDKVKKFVKRLLTVGNIHILITCRHSGPSWENTSVVYLEPNHVNNDISMYLDTAIKKLPVVNDHAYLEAEVKEYLLARADGVFRWVECQLTTLEECGTQKALRQALKTLPETLEKTYSEQLSKIKEFHKEDAKILLQWLTFSFEPLSILQCQEILTVDLEEQTFNPVKRESGLLQRLHKIVGSVLITISSEEVVQLAHHSVKEFLSCTYKVTPPAFFQIHDQLAHQVIAHTCLLYLQHYYVENNPLSTVWPLAEYAAFFWLQHRENISMVDSTLAHLCIQLFQEPAWSKWMNTWKSHKRLPDKTPMILAASHGLEEVVNHFLALGVKINHYQNCHYGYVLQAAAANGHESLVKLLLASGADVNAQDVFDGNALQAAAFNGHESVVKLLLALVDVNAQGGFYGNAMKAAGFNGHESVLKLLLDSGADVNAQGGKYANALQTAAAGGYESVVKLLLDSGADVNAQGGFHGYALQAAAYGGHESVVKLLLDSGADINIQGGEYGYALQAAAFNGHGSVVQLLLSSGADVNAQGGEYRYALQAAVLSGDESMVKLFLDLGADVNAQGGPCGNALQTAALMELESVLKLLLDSGADVNTQGGFYGYALQAAALGSHESVVKLLLDSGADVNAQGGLYENVLQAAALMGHESVVKLLLDSGADVNAQSGIYGNALQGAAQKGHEFVVELLIESGADVNAQGGQYENALLAAALMGHESVVKLLLDSGADVNAQGGLYGNALQAAALGSHESVVKLLLDSGADANAQGGLSENALQAALENHESGVKLLLETQVQNSTENL